MKLELLIVALVGAGTSAATYGTDRFGYALGALVAVGFILLWFRLCSRRGKPTDPVAQALSVFITLLMGAVLTPLLAGWDKLDWVPRPDPLIVEWRILAGWVIGLVVGVIVESAIYFVMSARTSAVSRAEKHGQAFGKTAVDFGAEKLHIPTPPPTDVPPAMFTPADKQAIRDAIPPGTQLSLSPTARRIIYGRRPAPDGAPAAPEGAHPSDRNDNDSD